MKSKEDFTGLVAVFGEILADVFPERSVPGGAPFNVARHLQVFGLRPLVISRIGNDALGAELLEEMVRLGMETAALQRDDRYPTGQVRVVLENGGHRFEILPDQAYDFIQPEPMSACLRAMPPQLAYFGTLAQRCAESRRAAQAFLRECQCPLFLDVNLRAPWYDLDTIAASLAAAHTVKLNDEELALVAAMFGWSALDEIEQARALQRTFDLEQVLATCGEKGCWLLDAQQRLHRAQPVPDTRPLVDTVGAGDAFAAVFLQGWLSGWTLQTTLQRACDYASAQCRVRGAAPQ
jgi:fructokinase